MRVNPRDVAAGAMFVAIGLFFSLNAWLNLRMGETFSMGPGYFPVVLGLLLVGFGLAIAILAIGRPVEAFGDVSWRGIGLVVVSIVYFAITVRGLGMAPALGGATLIAALSSKRTKFFEAAIASVCLTTFCILVFIYALRLPYPVVGSWITG